jgi:sarcosine oxidase subunit gamma
VIGATAPGHYGVAGSEVTLGEITVTTAWNVQGHPARAPFVAEVLRQFEVTLPLVPNTTTLSTGWTAFWLGPRSWLLVARTGSTGEPSLAPRPATFATSRDALNQVGGALFDVSASRVAFAVGGQHAASVLAKNCPLDFHARAFPAGHCAQSLLGHVNALIYRQEAPPVLIVMVARSFTRDVWHALAESAAQYGYDVVPTVTFSARRSSLSP